MPWQTPESVGSCDRTSLSGLGHESLRGGSSASRPSCSESPERGHDVRDEPKPIRLSLLCKIVSSFVSICLTGVCWAREINCAKSRRYSFFSDKVSGSPNPSFPKYTESVAVWIDASSLRKTLFESKNGVRDGTTQIFTLYGPIVEQAKLGCIPQCCYCQNGKLFCMELPGPEHVLAVER